MPLHGRADRPSKLIAEMGAALKNARAAAEQLKDLGRWGSGLRDTGERIAPLIAQPRSPPGLPKTG